MKLHPTRTIAVSDFRITFQDKDGSINTVDLERYVFSREIDTPEARLRDLDIFNSFQINSDKGLIFWDDLPKIDKRSGKVSMVKHEITSKELSNYLIA